MKTIFLHGLGQTPYDFEEVINKVHDRETDCPLLFSPSDEEADYYKILAKLEVRFKSEQKPFRICGLSLGAVLAVEYAAKHSEKVDSLILIAPQYKIPKLLLNLQNILFRLMPDKMFKDFGISRSGIIKLTHSMRSLDLSKKLGEILCPVTILCGEKDKANIRAAKKLSRLLPHARLYIVPGAGHELNKHSPGAIADVLNE